MKRALGILAALTLLLGLGMVGSTAALAQTGSGNGHGVGGFLDENGDGFNDLAPDADGDGIPNGMDPDYVRPADGSGKAKKFADGNGEKQGRRFWKRMRNQISAGDDTRAGDRFIGRGNGHGPGDGTGNGGSGPGDGSGNGPGNGVCDGSGANGRGGRR